MGNCLLHFCCLPCIVLGSFHICFVHRHLLLIQVQNSTNQVACLSLTILGYCCVSLYYKSSPCSHNQQILSNANTTLNLTHSCKDNWAGCTQWCIWALLILETQALFITANSQNCAQRIVHLLAFLTSNKFEISLVHTGSIKFQDNLTIYFLYLSNRLACCLCLHCTLKNQAMKFIYQFTYLT